MDSNINQPVQDPHPVGATKTRSALGNLGLGVGRVLPWAIITGLLYAAFFIKPKAAGNPVRPPAIERRDLLLGVSVAGKDRIWLAGNYGKILRSDDGALHWTVEHSNTDQNLQDIASWDASSAVAVGNDAVVVRTVDGGASWKPVSVPRSKIANKLVRVRLAAGGVGWAVGEAGAILRTQDSGVTWARMRPEEDVMMSDIDISDPANVWIAGESGRMFRSTDNGISWKMTQTDAKSSLMAISFRDARHGLTVGLDGVVLSTSDAGDHWAVIPTAATGNEQHLFGLIWDPAAKIWIAVGNKGVWLSIDPDLQHFRTGQFSKSDLSAHTALGLLPGRYLVAGASVGLWDGASWTPASQF